MEPDVLFENFPDVLLSSFRMQMLLGKVPADTVRLILEPLLANFYELMLQLPPDLQADFENILRIYPDVAERFQVSIKPPLVESLLSLSRYRQESGAGDRPNRVVEERFDESGLDMAAEPRTPFEVTRNSFLTSSAKEGQGFFTTDRSTPVYIEFSFSEGDDCACFQYKPTRLDIEIHICGVYVTTLTPSSPNRRVPVDGLLKVLDKCAPEIRIKIIEPA